MMSAPLQTIIKPCIYVLPLDISVIELFATSCCAKANRGWWILLYHVIIISGEKEVYI